MLVLNDGDNFSNGNVNVNRKFNSCLGFLQSFHDIVIGIRDLYSA